LNRNPFLKLETQKEDIIRAESIKPALKELIKENVINILHYKKNYIKFSFRKFSKMIIILIEH